MVQQAGGLPALPYTLKRPFIAFFKGLSYVLGLVALGLVLKFGQGGLLIALLFGGPTWLGLAIGAACSRQSLELLGDRLVFISSGHRNTVFYRDIRRAEAVLEASPVSGVRPLTLWLYHAGEAPSPLKINLKLFGWRERVILMGVIRRLAPQAQINALARQVEAGQARA